MNARSLSFFIALSIHVSNFAIAADSDLDPSFSVDGRVLFDQWQQSSPQHSIVQQSDGKLVLASSSYGQSLDRLKVARLRGDGTLDPSFGNAGIVTGNRDYEVAFDVIEQQDKRLVVSGADWQSGNAILWRFNSNGDTDKTFGTGGEVRAPDLNGSPVSKVLQQADGKLVIAGISDSTDGQLVLARFDTGGSPDPSFGNGGTANIDLAGHSDWYDVSALLQLGNGRLIVAAHTRGHLVVVRVTQDGMLDQNFGSSGVTAIAATEIDSDHTFTAGGSAATDGDGNIVVSASAMHCEEDAWGDCHLRQDGFIVKLKPSGTLDPTLAAGKIIVRGLGFSSVAIEADDTIVCAFEDTFSIGLMKFKTDGSVDTDFGVEGRTIADFGSGKLWLIYVSQEMIRQADGKHVVVAGYAVANTNIGWFPALARFGTDASGFAGLLGLGGGITYAFENGGPAILEVHRTGGSSGEISVDFRTVDGTALAEQDYVSQSGRLTWSNEDSSDKRIEIAIINDAQNEGDTPEIFGLQLADPTNGALLANSEVSVGIFDDEADSSTPPPPPSPSPSPQSGGGGATGVELLGLLGLLSVLVFAHANATRAKRRIRSRESGAKKLPSL